MLKEQETEIKLQASTLLRKEIDEKIGNLNRTINELRALEERVLARDQISPKWEWELGLLKEDTGPTSYQDRLHETESERLEKEREAQQLVHKFAEDRKLREKKKHEDHEKQFKKMLVEQKENEETKAERDQRKKDEQFKRRQELLVKRKRQKEERLSKKREWEHQEKLPKAKYQYQKMKEQYERSAESTELER